MGKLINQSKMETTKPQMEYLIGHMKKNLIVVMALVGALMGNIQFTGKVTFKAWDGPTLLTTQTLPTSKLNAPFISKLE